MTLNKDTIISSIQALVKKTGHKIITSWYERWSELYPDIPKRKHTHTQKEMQLSTALKIDHQPSVPKNNRNLPPKTLSEPLLPWNNPLRNECLGVQRSPLPSCRDQLHPLMWSWNPPLVLPAETSSPTLKLFESWRPEHCSVGPFLI